jgi:hypothetical protein
VTLAPPRKTEKFALLIEMSVFWYLASGGWPSSISEGRFKSLMIGDVRTTNLNHYQA